MTAEEFTGVTPDGRHLAAGGQTIEIPQRGFARPEPVAISVADPFYLPDVPASAWAWDPDANEWIPNPGPLAVAGIAPPSKLTMLMMKAVRRAHLRAKDGVFRIHPVDTWPAFHELSYLSLDLVLRVLEEHKVPGEVVDGHITLGAMLVAMEGQCWAGGPISAPAPDAMAAYEAGLRTRHAQYKRLKVNQELEKCTLAAAAGRVLEAASAFQGSPDERQRHAVMMRVLCHAEILSVHPAAQQVPPGFWGPQPERPGGQQFSDDGLQYWDGESWRPTCRSQDGHFFWGGEGWRSLPSLVPDEDEPLDDARQGQEPPRVPPDGQETDDGVSDRIAIERRYVVAVVDQANQDAVEVFKQWSEGSQSIDWMDHWTLAREFALFYLHVTDRFASPVLTIEQRRDALGPMALAVGHGMLLSSTEVVREDDPEVERSHELFMQDFNIRNGAYGPWSVGGEALSGDLVGEFARLVIHICNGPDNPIGTACVTEAAKRGCQQLAPASFVKDLAAYLKVAPEPPSGNEPAQEVTPPASTGEAMPGGDQSPRHGPVTLPPE